jgi:Na+/melibiose symporter-like transporter
MRAAKTAKKKSALLAMTKSIWLFPIICTIIILLLTAFKISGSSIGVYNTILYGSNHKDSSLVLNKPREIRSDEWVWN